MTFDELVSSLPRDTLLEVLDIADALSMRRSGYTVRTYNMIRQGQVPNDDDLSTNSDRMVKIAVWMHGKGKRTPALTGKEPVEVLDLLRGSMSGPAVDAALETMGLEEGLERVFGKEGQRRLVWR